MAIEGRHLHNCMADSRVRAQGWKLMQRAKRIAQRLGYGLAECGVTL